MFRFKALVTEEYGTNLFRRNIQERIINDVPENHSVVKVEYSSLNYKDALSARGHKGITRFYPHTPGIDASGVVEICNNGTFKSGDEVIVHGFDLGMNTNGGFGQYIVVPNDWILPLPKNLSLLEAMIYGTAGFTAAICTYEFMRNDINPGNSKILVTGATGGVGTMAVGILSHLGYDVIASTGKSENHNYLKSLGAKEILNRDEVLVNSPKPMLSSRWNGVVDNVGGDTLSSVIKSVSSHGCVCILGNVSGDTFTSTVYPFLLRGISLVGVDSASKSLQLKKDLWEKLSADWKFPMFDKISKVVSLDELSDEIDVILNGAQVGRVVVKLW